MAATSQGPKQMGDVEAEAARAQEEQALSYSDVVELASDVRLRRTGECKMGVSPESTFWNIMFSNAFGPGTVGLCLLQGDVLLGAVYLLSFYTSYQGSLMYAARFGDRDVLHRSYWVGFGIAMAGMLANSGLKDPAPGTSGCRPADFSAFAAFAAWDRFLHGFLYARVAYCLPDVRGFAATKAVEYIFVLGTFWTFVAAFCYSLDADKEARQFSTVKAFALVPLLMNLFGVVPHLSFRLRLANRVRVCLGPARARYGQLITMQKGLLVVSVATSIRGSWSGCTECYAIAACAVLVAVLMNVQHTWVENVPEELHATTQSVRTRNMWIGVQLVNLTSVTVCGTGFKRMLTKSVAGEPDTLGRELAAIGVAGMFFVAVVLDLIHNPPFQTLRPGAGHRSGENEEMDARFAGRGSEEIGSCWSALGRRRKRIAVNVAGMSISALLWMCSAVVEACALAALAVVTVSGIALDKRVAVYKRKSEPLAPKDLPNPF